MIYCDQIKINQLNPLHIIYSFYLPLSWGGGKKFSEKSTVKNTFFFLYIFYRECYIRFSSQNFTLKSNHESIHLCNHAIQRKYKNAKRDRRLPDENMWDSYTFRTHLKYVIYFI